MGFSLTDVLNAADNVVDATVKSGAAVVQGGAHAVGSVLDAVGAHDAAQSVDHWGDGVADEAGLAVGELKLGDTDDPTELVHGDAKRIGESVGHLRKFHSAFEETGTGLTRLDHEHWQGEAADAFRKVFEPQPKLWLTAADACEKAATALETYAHTVTWAQGQARQAIVIWKAAEKQRDAAIKEYNTRIDAYNWQVKAYNEASDKDRAATPPPEPGAFVNPAVAEFDHAVELLSAARKQRDEAGRTAVEAVAAAVGTAPAMPSRTPGSARTSRTAGSPPT